MAEEECEERTEKPETPFGYLLGAAENTTAKCKRLGGIFS